MPLYALEDLDDALAATRSFLWPVNRTRWIKLAVVVFFIGGPGTNANLFQYNVPADGGVPPGRVATVPDIGLGAWFVVGTIVAIALLLGLLFLLVGSIMEFVLIESLRREEVAVRRYWNRRWRQGFRLFGFRLIIGLIVVGSVAVLAILFLLPVAVEGGIGPSEPTGVFSGLALILLLPIIFVLALLVGVINGFTTVFVVPIMVIEECGVLDGWRRLWPTITDHPWQYLAYAVAGFVLGIAGGILVGIVVGISVLILLIPFGILGAVGVFLLTTVPPIGIGVLGIVGLLFVLSVLAIVAVAQVPVISYLRYYALFVLGDVDADLDLIAERRTAVRAQED